MQIAHPYGTHALQKPERVVRL